MTRVLVLGSNDRATLAVARSLGRCGIEIEVARIGQSSVAERSRYVATTIDLGSPALGVLPVADRLLERLDKQTYALVLPVNDPACVLAHAFRGEIEAFAPLALPGAEAFEASHDKSRTMKLCDELGIPRPATELLENWEAVQRLAAQPERFPAYVKPCYSARIVSGRMATFSVARVECFEQLEEQARYHIEKVPLLFQKPVVGVGVGLYFLAARGKILSMTQQQRLHEPRTGGGSSYRRTVPLDSRFSGWAESIAARLSWHGVAMIELKVDTSTGAAELMEINGRFWGSLPLTLRAGLDLPAWLFDLYHTGDLSTKMYAARVGIRQRNLRRDILWLAREARSAKGAKRAGVIGRWLGDFANLISGREGLDTESLTDPMPALAEWGEMVKLILRPIHRLAHRGLPMSLKTRSERLRLTETINQVGTMPRVLFICQGNICRSAFAEAYCRQIFGWREVSSAGLLDHFDRRPPRPLEEMAQRHFHVDMSPHRSRVLGQKLLSWADLVFVMEKGMVEDVVQRGQTRVRPFVLGILTDGEDILDPLHRPEDSVSAILSQLVASLKSLRDTFPEEICMVRAPHGDDRSAGTSTVAEKEC